MNVTRFPKWQYLCGGRRVRTGPPSPIFRTSRENTKKTKNLYFIKVLALFSIAQEKARYLLLHFPTHIYLSNKPLSFSFFYSADSWGRHRTWPKKYYLLCNKGVFRGFQVLLNLPSIHKGDDKKELLFRNQHLLNFIKLSPHWTAH